MKILKMRDCERTDPPSTAFVMFPEIESDLAFLAEVRDLPSCNRVLDAFPRPEQTEEAAKAREAGITPRMSFQSFFEHLQDSPNSNEKYARETLMWATLVLGVDSQTLLKKAFWIRTYWF